MGTSSIFHGQTKSNVLLPDDFDNETIENDDYNEQNQYDVTWATVKSNFSKYINSKSGRSLRGGGTINHVAKQYVRAAGGTKKLMSIAKSGVFSGRNLYNFYNSIVNTGISNTLKSLHIQLQGKSANEIISILINAISPNSVTKEDIIARDATQYALSHLYDYIERNDMEIECLDNMPQSLIDISMCAYIESYIWGVMLKDLASRLEIYENDPKAAFEIEQELKGYIKGIVEVEFKKDDEIFQKNPTNIVDSLMKRCFLAMEGIV